MKIAIMQPYTFPYIGYFQLINAVDRFIIYDDVNYIKNGWINRNKILVQNSANIFTIPLDNPSSYKTINNTYINDRIFSFWKKKFIKTIQQSYSKAPYYKEVFLLIESVLSIDSANYTISNLATDSIIKVCKYLKIHTEIKTTSTVFNNIDLSGKSRVIDICKQEKATVYINPIGGQQLYKKEHFSDYSIDLHFIKSNQIYYKQFGKEFVPWLSIIDILMFNNVSEVQMMLHKYSLV